MNADDSEYKTLSPINVRLKDSIGLFRMKSDISMRGMDYDAFKLTPQIKGIVSFAFSEILTDGVGNVLQMPMRVPDCFGDIVTMHRWNRVNSIAEGRSKRRPWLKVNIPARCTSCKATHACRGLGRERVQSDPRVKAAFEQWEKLEQRLGKGKYGPVWANFVDTVAVHWKWSAMEAERLAFAKRREVQAETVRRENDRARKSARRAKLKAAKATNSPPLPDASLEAERLTRERKLVRCLAITPRSQALRKVSYIDADRVAAVWLARELLTRSESSTATAGKIAKLLPTLTFAGREGEALRARVQADLRIIAVLESPQGCWF